MSPTPPAIRVLTLADSRYAMPLAVMLRSLLETATPGRPIEITVIDGGISKADKERIQASLEGFAPRIRYVAVPDRCLSLPVYGRVPPITYARLVLDEYYQGGSGKILVLDSDILVLSPLDSLIDDIHGDPILAACVDPFITTVSMVDGLAFWRELGMRHDTPYFNAGVMVIDLERWRDANITDRAIRYIDANHRQLRQYDQDGLNAVLAGRWRHLDARWNCQPRTGNSLGLDWPAKPGIIHFSGRLKPWLYRGSHPADLAYFSALDRTQWRGFRPSRLTLTSLAYSLYDSPARRWIHPVESRCLAWQRRLTLMLQGAKT